MGNQIVWQDRFNIGVEIIDKEHRKLFNIINRLFSSMDQGTKSQWSCQESLKYFKEHALKHFTEEEAYMAKIDYPDFETHRKLHDDFRRKTLPELEKELMQTDYAPEAVNHFLGVCAGWLIGHTLTEDHAITGKTESKWTGLIPEDLRAAMRKTILKILDELFQLNARVLSDHYGGEKFGEGIYYRLVYSTGQKNERWEIILVFEEQLILNTMGEMLGTQAKKLNVMLMNATRFAAQQCIDRILEHFPDANLYELREENLLTYEQFQQVFERENPQFSLLFNTGAGYFAFCAIAPHLLESHGEKPIKEENAMSDIKQYLEQSAEPQKKKILVVDDSDVVLKSIENLLSETYQISLVKSGLSAIRAITLNRPDLILLDYEMPVCDGQQVLQMIRAEEDFAAIPVIFLTGRVDRESVTKVMALKPAGYLSKTMDPAYIKQSIDSFFEQLAKVQGKKS